MWLKVTLQQFKIFQQKKKLKVKTFWNYFWTIKTYLIIIAISEFFFFLQILGYLSQLLANNFFSLFLSSSLALSLSLLLSVNHSHLCEVQCHLLQSVAMDRNNFASCGLFSHQFIIFPYFSPSFPIILSLSLFLSPLFPIYIIFRFSIFEKKFSNLKWKVQICYEDEWKLTLKLQKFWWSQQHNISLLSRISNLLKGQKSL